MKESKRIKKILTIVAIIVAIIIFLLLFKSCSSKENDKTIINNSNITQEVIDNSIAKDENNAEIIEKVEEKVEETDGEDDKQSISYYVNFLNIDGTILQRSLYAKGELPSYKGGVPTYSDDSYTYTFIGWDKSITKVKTSQTYTATYDKALKTSAVVKKKNPIVTAPTAVANLVYSGNDQTLIEAGSTTGGTMQYKLADEEYSTSLPQAKNAGTYIVYYKVIGNSTYNDVEELSITVTINKAPLTIVPNNTQSKIYDGSTATNITYTYSGQKAGEIPGFSGNLGLLGNAINSGTYEIVKNTLTLSDNASGNFKSSNYDATFTSGINYTINKATSSIDTSGVTKTYTYTGSEQTINSGATLNHTETTLSYTNNKFTNVGTGNKTITISSAETANYKSASTTVVITINKAKVSLPIANTGLIYTGSEQTGVTLSNGAKYTLSNNTATDAGSYTATATLKDAANYVWDGKNTSNDQTISWSIDRKNASLTISSTSVSYTYPTNGSFTYTYDGDGVVTATSSDTNVATASVSTSTKTVTIVPVSVGSTTITINAGQGTNYKSTSAEHDATVNAGTIVVTKNPASDLVYSNKPLDLGSVTTDVGGCTIVYKVNSDAYSSSLPQATNAGNYTVGYKVEKDNYNTIESTFDVSIERATQTISPPELGTGGSGSITLKEITSGHGTTYYGCCEENDATKVTNWTESYIITNLTANKSYYFFAKYAGDSNYKETISEGTKISTSSCFVSGTKISMFDGTKKNIEDVEIGDSIKAYDVAKDEFYTTVVNNKWESSNNTIATITLADGTSVQCTPNHPLCSVDGWKSADPNFAGGLKEFSSTKLEIGDEIITDHGVFSVISIDVNIGEIVSVYNLSVESNGDINNNTFVANGVVTHNKPG